MVLPVDIEKYSYRFFKNLNNDVKLVSNEYGEWDVDFNYELNDWVNVDGFESLANACIIAIMTRFQEENFLPPYVDFGCRIHELIKANKSRNVIYLIELYVTETLNSMRRVKKVNWVLVEDNPGREYYNYSVRFSVTVRRDEDYDERVEELDYDIIEEMFYI